MGQRFQTQDQLQLCRSWQSHAHVALHPFYEGDQVSRICCSVQVENNEFTDFSHTS
jgi:hypothetical protein